jgi:uncharacterized protein YgbK (DUF1537 family)
MIAADDLTGACDAAVAFTSSCYPVRVRISGDSPASTRISAITTESRDLPLVEAEACLESIAKRLPTDSELFKKVDSVFRGNTVAEIAVVLRLIRFDLAILAPAYPALRRTLHDGVLHIHDVTGSRTLPITQLLSAAGCSFTALPAHQADDVLVAAMRDRLDRPNAVFLCDASSQDDLERVVRVARSLGKQILWIGSGGLAHALAAQLPPVITQHAEHPRAGRAIFFVGSPHSVTSEQVSHLQRTIQIAEHPHNSSPPSATDLLIPIALGETSAVDIRRAVSALDPRQVGSLFMTGGDTAHFVCRALEIHSLRLLHEFAPGIPVAIAEGGRFDGVRVVLKSGGFGEPDLLCRLLEAHRATIEVSA